MGKGPGYLGGRDLSGENEVVESYDRNLRGEVEKIEGDQYTLKRGEDTLVITIPEGARIDLIPTEPVDEELSEEEAEASPSTVLVDPVTGSVSDIEVGNTVVVSQSKDNGGYTTQYVGVLKF